MSSVSEKNSDNVMPKPAQIFSRDDTDGCIFLRYQVDIVDCQAEMERLYEQTETICKSLRQRAESIRQQKEVLQKQWLEYMETIG